MMKYRVDVPIFRDDIVPKKKRGGKEKKAKKVETERNAGGMRSTGFVSTKQATYGVFFLRGAAVQ